MFSPRTALFVRLCFRQVATLTQITCNPLLRNDLTALPPQKSLATKPFAGHRIVKTGKPVKPGRANHSTLADRRGFGGATGSSGGSGGGVAPRSSPDHSGRLLRAFRALEAWNCVLRLNWTLNGRWWLPLLPAILLSWLSVAPRLKLDTFPNGFHCPAGGIVL